MDERRTVRYRRPRRFRPIEGLSDTTIIFLDRPWSRAIGYCAVSRLNLDGGERLARGDRGSSARVQTCLHIPKTIVRGGRLSVVHVVIVLVRRYRTRLAASRTRFPCILRDRRLLTVVLFANDVVGPCPVSRRGYLIGKREGKVLNRVA